MIRIQVADLLHVDGTITAAGGLYVGNHSAGGSGGGIFLMGRRFQGSDTGQMTARGGYGYSYFHSPGMAFWQEGQRPSDNRFSRTWKPWRRITGVPQAGHEVTSPP